MTRTCVGIVMYGAALAAGLAAAVVWGYAIGAFAFFVLIWATFLSHVILFSTFELAELYRLNPPDPKFLRCSRG
jgi:hypothetical protein